MFGQTGNTSFGGFSSATQNSPFGQSAFRKTITTTSFGSGTTPVFGGANTSLFSAKTTTGGLFGSTTTTPAFGQPTTTQPSFGGFGTTNTSTNLFGTQQNANTNLFGSTTATPAFGQTNKSAGFGFGATTGANLFGQPQQNTQQIMPFGQTNTTANTNLFGLSGGFGPVNTTAGVTGTTIKFKPVSGSDTMVKNGQTQTIPTRHHCITCMKEYESKSFEELRLEDYMAGRKGANQGQTTGLFSATAQPSPFGAAAAGTSTATSGFGTMASGFGTTSQSGTPNLFGKPMTGFGAPTTTTNGFAFNSTGTSNFFGASTQPKPYGTTTTPLFATANSNQPTGTGFGTTNTTQNTGFGTFGTAPANQSIGLFNQNKSAFNVPSSTSNTGFGFGQTPVSNAGSTFFGAKPAGTTGFGSTPAFGTTAPSGFGTGTGFGTTQNAGSNLFNTSFKSTGQTSGFSFGTTPVSSTGLGLGTNTGLSLGGGSTLFGQQKPGSLFGNTATNTTFNTTGTFGTTSAFGANANTSTGLGTNLLGGGLSTNQVQAAGAVPPVHQQILALVSAPFGDSPLLKNLLPASGKTEELLKPTNAASRMLNSPQFKVSTNNKSPKIKTRVVSAAQLSKKSLFEGLEEEDPSLSEAFQPRPNAKRLVLRPKSMTNASVNSSNENTRNSIVENGKNDSGQDDNAVEAVGKENQRQDGLNLRQPAQDRQSSVSWLKSSLPRKSKGLDEDESFDGQRSPFGKNHREETLQNTIAELRPQSGGQNQNQSGLNDTIESIPYNTSLAEKSSLADVTTHSNSDSSHDLEVSSLSVLQMANHEPNLAKVTLRRVGYYTIPSLDKLDSYVCGESCVVPNFTVGREGYGNVYFPDSFDIYGLNLDEIVHFRHKEVIIYPDDEQKPPVGQGLNRRAQVTLDRVWPHDKSLHEPITDPHRLAAMNYEAKLRKVSAKHDTRFLEYRPETGSWVFKVDHFSKYGLSDSDEEEAAVPPPATLSVDKAKTKASVAQEKRLGKRLSQLSKKSAFGQDSCLQEVGQKVAERFGDGESLTEDATSPEDLFCDGLGVRTLKLNDSKSVRTTLSPTATYARIVGTDSHKLQLMKASFFDDEDYADDDFPCNDLCVTDFQDRMDVYGGIFDTSLAREGKRRKESVSAPLLRTNLSIAHRESPLLSDYEERERFDKFDETMSKAKWSKKSVESLAETQPPSILGRPFPEPTVKPVTAILKCRSEVIPFEKSVVNKLMKQSRCLADVGIQMGRMFRPSWGPGLTLLSLSTQDQASKVPLSDAFSQLGSYVSGRLLGDTTSTTIVQRLRILGGNGADEGTTEMFKRSIEGHLRIQLEHCVMGQEGDCPIIDVSKEQATSALHAHCTLAQMLAERPGADHLAVYTSDVWKLCVALWGDLPELSKLASDSSKHYEVMARRRAVEEWLKEVVNREQNAGDDLDVVHGKEDRKMFSLLTTFRLEEACQLARKTGDHCLALLMAQLRSGKPVKELTKQQLALWQEIDADQNISISRLKLFMLAAGEPLIVSKHGTINVCHGLDWKRAFAMHVWYLSSPTASIADTLDLYEASFDEPEGVYSAAPEPQYATSKDPDVPFVETSSGKPIRDLCFHLAKLYCTGNHSLAELLNTATYTADPLDYRLSWLMQQTLTALGYAHLSGHVAVLTHVNFATQLEAHGLWHWAIFVVLHLKDAARRRTAVRNLLERHVEIDDSQEYAKREEFLREELGISGAWIQRAKAVKCRVAKRYSEAAWYYIQAELWNVAHEIVIEHIAADAIINENYDYLRSLLEPLAAEESSSTISNWSSQGQLLWDYMEITIEIENLLRSSDTRGLSYKLQSLKPQLTSLCHKISLFPCPTAKHRLCQAEIAKRTLHLARSLLLMQAKEDGSTTNLLVNLISQLPLPEDYAQQELRPIVNMRINEVIAHSV